MTGSSDASHTTHRPRHRESKGRYGQGRGKGWAKLRKQVMDRDRWLCQPCARAGRITVATECDHITPICNGGNDDPLNLQAICTDCHKAKSAQEANGGRDVIVRGCDPDGRPHGRPDW